MPPTQYTSPTPQDIQYSGAPNAIIAAVWTDLQPDASTKIFTGIYQETLGYTYFVITWQNIKHKASGQRLTFQIILDNAWDYQRLVQSVISISYMDVKAINTQFTWGIEDQQGCKGLGDLCDGTSLQDFNGKTIAFSQNSSSFYLKKLTITLQDTCTQTKFNILEPPDSPLCGYHILGGNEEPTPAGAFLLALMGTGALLLSAWSGAGELAVAGFILDTSLVVLDSAEVAELATRQYGNRLVDVYDKQDQQINWAEAYAYTDVCVDASLSIFVDWILDDTDDYQNHSLTITAKAEYRDLTNPDYPIDKPPITTTVNLEIKPDDNNSFDKAYTIEEGTYSWLYIDITYDSVDYYKIWVPQYYEIGAMITIGPSYPDQDYNLYLYAPYDLNQPKDKSELGAGQTDYVITIADSEGYWYIKVNSTSGNWGFYSLRVVISDLPKPPPETPSTPSGPNSGHTGKTYSYSTNTTDPNGDSIYYEFNWGDGTTNKTGSYFSGATASASHSWSSPGTYNITVRAQDLNGFWSGWSLPLTVTIEPSLLAILNTLGFTNLEESTIETFIPGTYKITLYAEFAGYHTSNELSWYPVGTTQYNLIFSGPEGNFGYVNPPIVKTFTANSNFSLSFLSGDGHRYFTETSKNPDAPIKHAMIYKNLDNPYMYLIGFENKLGEGGDKDYNDMVISLDHVTLTVLAEENGTNLTNGRVYIDGQYRGCTGSTFTVVAGTRTILVNGFWENNNTGYRYVFKNWTDGSLENPKTMTVTDDTTIKAYFFKEYCPGDVNGDGTCSAFDMLVLKVILTKIGQGTLTPEEALKQNPYADLNCDRQITVADMLILKVWLTKLG